MVERTGRWLLLLIAVSSPQVLAEETPSMELLEFLATWEREGDAWQDPLQMQEILSDELAENTVQEKPHE